MLSFTHFIFKITFKSREMYDKISRNYQYFTCHRHDIDILKITDIYCAELHNKVTSSVRGKLNMKFQFLPRDAIQARP